MPHFDTLIGALEAAPPERPFITFWIDEDEQQSVTFGEFRQRSAAQALTLREHGVSQGDRVVTLMPQSIAGMTVFVGAMMLGAVPAFLAYPNFKIEPAKYRSGLSGVTANLWAKVIVIDEEFPEEMLGHVTLAAQTALVRARNCNLDTQKELPHACSPQQIAFIQHSAGTTGLQKGVPLTHAAVLKQIEYLSGVLQSGGSDRIYSWLPLYHDMGLIACFMLPMASHIPVIMQSPLDWVMQPETMLQIIDQHRCTLAWMPNFAFQFLARRTPPKQRDQYDLSSLRALINCSEPVRASSMDEFKSAFARTGLRDGVLQSSYAMAENVFAVTQSPVGHEPRRLHAAADRFRAQHFIAAVEQHTPGALSFTSSGRLLPNHQVRIVSDSGEHLADDHVGEILVRSDCLFDGYYNRPDLTTGALTDGWYRTGDLGFLHGGELFVVGRKKDLIIVGGENLYPQDIEEIVGQHPAIHDGRAVAMGVYNTELGTEDIVVVAEVEDDANLKNSDALERELRSSVVAALGISVRRIFLKPTKWIVKSSAGKPARSATRDKLFQEHPELNPQPEETQPA